MALEPSFLLCKNPYHLFTAFRKKKFRASQKDSALAIRQQLSKRDPSISITTIGEFLQPAYFDLAANENLSIHIRAMQKVLSAELEGTNVDLLNLETRADLEGLVKYEFPDRDDLKANAEYNELRGIWQLLQPSLKHDHLKPGEAWVRTALLVIYGFVTDRERELEKKTIGLLIVGPTTIWRAQAWISAAQKLYIHAHDCLRHGTHELLEDQFFVFDVSKSHDPYVRDRTYSPAHVEYDKLQCIQGILSGTSLDENYRSSYPAAAVACVARKLYGWSDWFKSNDRIIDPNYAIDLRKNMELGYYRLQDFRERTHSVPFEGASRLRSRNHEASFKLDAVLDLICSEDGVLLRPILRNSGGFQD